ncbi:MAG: 8-methylmenaquinol:fumarate reductase membrane anchor subunit [Syntrophomonadaceae bacterium]|nr:8-methylmenaquinol:fumarate reductase membrane anchor subunit [Bacillota bacterium]
MRYSYYPGCTLKTMAKVYEDTALSTAKALGLSLTEVKEWQCCGALYPLNTDEIFSFFSPVRALLQARAAGEDKLVTLCAGCYNVFKRTNNAVRENRELRRKINAYLEEDYMGEVDVVHYLEVLKNDLGFEVLAEKVKKKLTGRKLAPYYGCLLLKPRAEMGFDDVENPTIFENFLTALGATAVDYPYKTECCGSYLSMANEEVASTAVGRILNSAYKNGAEAFVVACPLCKYNLEEYQKELCEVSVASHPKLPVFYFTEILAEALALA